MFVSKTNSTWDVLYVLVLLFTPKISSSWTPPDRLLDRRDAILQVGTDTTLASTILTTANIDAGFSRVIVPTQDPPPLLSLPAYTTRITIPRVGYSLYKTSSDQAERCVSLALFAGVSHFDLATLYGSNAMVGKTLQKYLSGGRQALKESLAKIEKPEVIEVLDKANQKTAENMPFDAGNLVQRWLGGSEKARRKSLFLSHKLSNEEQSTDSKEIRHSVVSAIQNLSSGGFLDMVSIHSPLTDSSRRLGTYEALLELQSEGRVRSVGVCNYGLGPLKEILDAGLPLPAVNQLELSPFSTHSEVVDWCDSHGVAVSCAAWSRLSSADGPTEQWDVLSRLAVQKGMTKAQILVRWSLQKGYICVPRSGATSKLEQIAIAENSYGGVHKRNKGSDSLSDEEMNVLDRLNVDYKAGKLGRRDGWKDTDVSGPTWDPTDFV